MLGPGILRVAFVDDAIVSGKEEDFLGVGKALEIGAAGCGDGILGSEQVVDVSGRFKVLFCSPERRGAGNRGSLLGGLI